MKSNGRKILALLALLALIERGHSAVFMQKGTAIAKILNTKKVYQGPTIPIRGTHRFLTGKQKNAQWKYTTYYSKDRSGRVKDLVLIVKNFVYPPNCDHEWAIGVDAKTMKVTEVQVLEMTCPHAFPTKKRGFLDQFVGKGPKEGRSIASSIATEATATGSSELTADAVEHAITAARKAIHKIKD